MWIRFFWYRRWSSLILWLSATPLSLRTLCQFFFYNVALPFHLLCSHCNILYAMKCAMVLLSVHTFFILECIKIFFLKIEGKKYGISNPFNSFHTWLCYVEQFFWKTLAMRCCLMFFLHPGDRAMRKKRNRKHFASIFSYQKIWSFGITCEKHLISDTEAIRKAFFLKS